MNYEELALNELKPYERNPRKNDRAVDGVAESIKQFGFKQPIVVDKNNVIVAGHTRYKAAKKLGLTIVPVVRADDLTEKQVKAYRILDNKLNELSYWDFDLLDVELADFDFDFEPFNVEFPTFELIQEEEEDEGSAPNNEEDEENEDEQVRVDLEPKASKIYTTDLTTPLSWMGSKVRMRNNINAIIKNVVRDSYVEPFGGAGGMFCGKAPEKNEVYNDINGLLCNFFRVLRDNDKLAELKRLCDVTPQSRQFWHEFRAIAYAFLNGDEKKLAEQKEKCNLAWASDELATAFAIFYCQVLGFGGAFLSAYGGGCKEASSVARKYRNKIESFDGYHKRFEFVNIENLDWKDCIEKYDREGTLFYVDPPYECKTADAYESGWTTDETRVLADTLIKCKAKVVLSCYDCEALWRLRENGFQVKHFHAVSSVARNNKNMNRVETVYYRLGEGEEPESELWE